MKGKGPGWHRDSRRHALAARGVKTKDGKTPPWMAVGPKDYPYQESIIDALEDHAGDAYGAVEDAEEDGNELAYYSAKEEYNAIDAFLGDIKLHGLAKAISHLESQIQNPKSKRHKDILEGISNAIIGGQNAGKRMAEKKKAHSKKPKEVYAVDPEGYDHLITDMTKDETGRFDVPKGYWTELKPYRKPSTGEVFYLSDPTVDETTIHPVEKGYWEKVEE